jgi:hypothetical protein
VYFETFCGRNSGVDSVLAKTLDADSDSDSDSASANSQACGIKLDDDCETLPTILHIDCPIPQVGRETSPSEIV